MKIEASFGTLAASARNYKASRPPTIAGSCSRDRISAQLAAKSRVGPARQLIGCCCHTRRTPAIHFFVCTYQEGKNDNGGGSYLVNVSAAWTTVAAGNQ